MVSDYWFFLSYARLDAGERYVPEFCESVAAEVARQAALRSQVEEVAFRDLDNIELGDEWPEALTDALRTSRTLLCLCSTAYFQSPMCGKEFAFFRSLGTHTAAPSETQPRPAPRIIPILWDPLDRIKSQMPEAIRALQFSQSSLGEPYASKGARALLYRGRTNPDFLAFRDRLAEIIVSRGSELGPRSDPTRLQGLEHIENAFAPSPAREPGTAPSDGGGSAQTLGARTAKFAYVVASRSELVGVKDVLHGYPAEGGWAWEPFHPDDDSTLGLVAQQAALSAKAYLRELPLTDDFIAQLEEAERTNTVVVVLVDPWTLRTAVFNDHLRTFNGRLFINSVVVIVWNDRDDETARRRAELEDVTRQVFDRHFLMNSAGIKEFSGSPDELHATILNTITEIRGRLMTRGGVLQTVLPSRQSTIPVLSGPGGSNP